MQKCAEAWLVSLEYDLPSDPGVAYSGVEPIIGCNHLVCSNCGADVRHVDHRAAKSNYPPAQSDLSALYQSVDPDSELLDGSPKYREARTYFCKCELVGVDSGARWTDTIDQPWTCGGHAASETHARIAAARKATDALIAGANLASPGPSKIAIAPAAPFASAAELRDSLLGSYPDAAYFGNKPLVRKTRDDTGPAWEWVIELLGKRTDWWPALGIAIQHAAKEGGELARAALVHILADFQASFALLPWTAPLAAEWPEVHPDDGAATGWGAPEYTLASIIRDQSTFHATMTADLSEAFLTGYGKNGKDLDAALVTEDDLRALLDKTATAGQFPGGDKGPWSWIGFQRLIRGEQLDRQFLAIISTFDKVDINVRALLDWFVEERDLWRFVPLLERWVASHPAWWSAAADTKPAGWKYNMRSAHWPNITNLGSIVVETLRRAKAQLATPPILDLPQLYGAPVS